MTIFFLSLVLVLQLPVGEISLGQDQTTLEFDSAVLQIIEKTEVPATSSGPIRELLVKQGDIVKPDQVLATIENSSASIALRESVLEFEIAKSKAASTLDIDFARKSLDVAKVDLRRAQESNQQYDGVVSDREMDRLRLLVEKSNAELAKIKFDKTVLQLQQKLKRTAVDKRELELGQHRIKTKSGGQIVEIAKREGEWVNLSDTVIHVARLDKLRVEEYLPAEQADSQLLNAEASFSIVVSAKEEKLATGKVVYVNPEINPLNSTVMVWVEFDNRKLNLRPGMKGKISIKKTSNADRASASK